MTDATDSLRPTKWRALVADLHDLIAKRVSCLDESPPISSQLSALLATADFAALFTHRLLHALAHLLGWDDDIDAAPLRDQFLVAMGHCNSFAAERAATVVPFLLCVYNISRCDPPTPGLLSALIDSLRRMIGPQRSAKPVRAPDAANSALPSNTRSSALPSYTTPLKSKSASHFIPRTTHKDVDEFLDAEMKGHLWRCADMGFFDRFFPLVEGLPIPEPFPDDPQQDVLFAWFYSYDDIYRQWRRERNFADSKWSLKVSPERPLLHPTIDRKVDIFFYDDHLQFSDEQVKKTSRRSKDRPSSQEQADWRKVVVFAEVKCEKNLTDLRRKVILQLAGYARQIFHRQPARQHVHAFSVINSKFRCWLFTRSGGYASKSVDLKSEEGIATFCRVFHGYADMTVNDMGQAPLDAGGLTGDFLVEYGNAFFVTDAVVTRGTTCWPARPVQPSTKPAENQTDKQTMPWVLKVSWRHKDRQHEGAMLQKCGDCQVKGIAQYIAHDEGSLGSPNSVHSILGKRCLDAAVPLDLDWKANKRPGPHTPSQSKRFKPSNDVGGKRSLMSDPSSTSATNLVFSPPSSSQHRPIFGETSDNNNSMPVPDTPQTPLIPDRIYTRLLMGRGKPIDKFEDVPELLRAMRDAVKGHRSLLLDGHMLHRDISINNIMITIPECPRPDGYTGFLIDLDHAIAADSVGRHSTIPERTGTFEFISIDALKKYQSFRHIYYDDLQSFMWVFFWIAIKNPTQCPTTRAWSGIDPTRTDPMCTGLLKKGHLDSDEDFEAYILRYFDPALGTAVEQAAKDLRSALWPVSSRRDLEVEMIRDAKYEMVIRAFEEALVVAESEKPELPRRVVAP